MNRDEAREVAIRQLLLDYNCRFTCEVDDKLTGLNLMDKLCAPDAEDISTGREEIEALAEYLDFDAGYQAREDVASAPWVSVRERLPEQPGDYFVMRSIWNSDGEYLTQQAYVMQFDEDEPDGWSDITDEVWDRFAQVEAWMPIPEYNAERLLKTDDEDESENPYHLTGDELDRAVAAKIAGESR